ncbi:MAG: ribonuclease Z [Nitrososphaeraceae archaeon]|nr:ribonuclease Z [Nitrososphaeraceae archaeon]
MKLIFLGTAGAVPTENRGLSSVAVVRGSEILIFDTGEGMQMRFIKSNLGMNKKMKIFITHMHGDHCIGLLGLLQTLSIMGRQKDIDIYGEPNLRKFIIQNIKIINFKLNYRIIIHSVTKEGIIVKEKEYKIACCLAEHSKLNYSFCLEEFNRPGIFYVEKVKSLGVPEGKKYSYLQHGRDIIFKGKKLISREFTGLPRPGRKIGISGDTRPTSKLEKFFNNCDILVFEATFSHKQMEKAKKSYHSTATEAAILAKRSNSKKLILTHFSARYKKTEDMELEAKEFFENVFIANDLDMIAVPYSNY